MTGQDVRWYLLGTLSRGQELKIRDDMRREGLECFVPLRYVVRTIKNHRQRTMVPALTGLIFIRGELDQLKEKIQFHKERLYLRKSTFTNHEDYLTVSDHDMKNFIAVTEQAGEKILYFNPEEIQLREGDKIRVNGGPYDGREGYIMRVKGKRRKQLVVSIPGIVFAAVEMEPELIELVSTTTQRSKNVEEDKTALFKLAHRLLFEIPSAYQHEKEYYLLLGELKRTADRLKPLKGYLPAQEAELALPLYLAAMKLQDNVASVEQRLRSALSHLQDTSLLKLRASMYLAVLSQDAEALAFVNARFSAWRQSKLSSSQQALLDEFNFISASPCQT